MRKLLFLFCLLAVTHRGAAQEEVILRIDTVTPEFDPIYDKYDEEKHGNDSEESKLLEVIDHHLPYKYLIFTVKKYVQQRDIANFLESLSLSKLTIWPLKSSRRIICSFGHQLPFYQENNEEINLGIEIKAEEKDDVLAVGTGVVEKIGYKPFGLGNYIYIYHGHGIYSIYGHLSTWLVREGHTVGEGQIIGKVGSTGYSKEVALFFAVYYGYFNPNEAYSRTYYNPELYIRHK